MSVAAKQQQVEQSIEPGRYWVTWKVTRNGAEVLESRRVLVYHSAGALVYSFADANWIRYPESFEMSVAIALDPQNPVRPSFEREGEDERPAMEGKPSNPEEARLRRYISKLESKLSGDLLKPGVRREARPEASFGADWVDYGCCTHDGAARMCAIDQAVDDGTVIQVREVGTDKVLRIPVRRELQYVTGLPIR